MLLLFSLENELQASRAVTGILILFLIIGIGVNAYLLYKRWPGKLWIGIRGSFILLMGGLLFPTVQRFMLDHAMLTDARTVIGRTEGYCQVPLRGEGIRFSYKVDGKRYSNCNSYHPVPRDSIEVPDGLFKVRYSPDHPGKGRMNFREPVLADSTAEQK